MEWAPQIGGTEQQDACIVSDYAARAAYAFPAFQEGNPFQAMRKATDCRSRIQMINLKAQNSLFAILLPAMLMSTESGQTALPCNNSARHGNQLSAGYEETGSFMLCTPLAAGLERSLLFPEKDERARGHRRCHHERAGTTLPGTRHFSGGERTTAFCSGPCPAKATTVPFQCRRARDVRSRIRRTQQHSPPENPRNSSVQLIACILGNNTEAAKPKIVGLPPYLSWEG